jgi:hypothetical protein
MKKYIIPTLQGPISSVALSVTGRVHIGARAQLDIKLIWSGYSKAQLVVRGLESWLGTREVPPTEPQL